MSRRASWQWFRSSGATVLLVVIGVLSAACSSERTPPEDVGQAEVALTNIPSDVRCVRLTIEGPKRTDVRKFPVSTGQHAVFRMEGLPVGKDTFTAHAFSASCGNLAGANPTWYSEPVAANVRAGILTHVSLSMIHNGRASVGIDFGDGNGPSDGGEPPLEGGFQTDEPNYQVPIGCPVKQQAMLTTGDSPDKKYRMVGAPHGLGAFDNGDGTFTLFVNHELAATQGIVRAHGARGAFVSKWTIRKLDLAVMAGSDLIQQVSLWDPKKGGYALPAKVAFGRLSSADLPQPSALLDPASGLGFDGRLLFNGEQTGVEGRAFAHAMDGRSYELPRMGKANWENIVPNPGSGKRTVVIGLDDAAGGQLYVYVGEKNSDGGSIDKAGLTNGALFGVRVPGFPRETLDGLPESPFELAPFGNVENASGGELEKQSQEALVTGFARPQDGAWDPNSPNDFYFVTAAAFNLPSRLWRLRFFDASSPEQGGRIEMLLDGTEGQHMLDDVVVDRKGHVYLQEDPGNNAHLAKIWRYDIGSDQLSEVARHDPALFVEGSNTFLTQDEESSGIIDMTDILGPGRFLLATGVHLANRYSELVEGGQLSSMLDNDGLGSVMAALATLMVECTGTIGPDSFVLNADGFLGLPNAANGEAFRCNTDEGIRLHKDGAMRAYLSLQFPRPETVPGDPNSQLVIPGAKECIAGRWGAWKEAFKQTGITQDQCPAWKRTSSSRTDIREQVAELAKSGPLSEEKPEGLDGRTQSPPDLENFKVFRDFDVAFQQARPDHACVQKGPGACAALCAGAFPGFVIATSDSNVTIDAMEWLEDDTFPVSTDNPFLSLGYYHPMWAYGEAFGNRMRANSCDAHAKLFSQCKQAIVTGPGSPQTRSCSANSIDPSITNDNCASEICTVQVNPTTFRQVRLRLNCLQTIDDFDPAGGADAEAAWQANWDTCVSHCYLPP